MFIVPLGKALHLQVHSVDPGESGYLAVTVNEQLGTSGCLYAPEGAPKDFKVMNRSSHQTENLHLQLYALAKCLQIHLSIGYPVCVQNT